MAMDTGSGMTHDGAEERADMVERLLKVAGVREEPPREDYERVLAAATAALWAQRSRQRRQRGLRTAGLAAALLAGVAVVLRLVPAPAAPAAAERVVGEAIVLGTGDDFWRPLRAADGPLAAGDTIRTTAGGRVALRLASGASLRIDELTEVVLASAGRMELRRGAVYVDSGAEARSDGVVEVVTAMGTARDVGTQFQVRVSLEALRVWVREGVVALQYGTQSASAAGEQLTLWSSGVLERAALLRSDPGWGWIESVAVAPPIDNRPLASVLAWIGRETGREIRYSSADAEQRARTVILHGSVHDLVPLDALDAALATTDLGYTLLPDGAILIRPR